MNPDMFLVARTRNASISNQLEIKMKDVGRNFGIWHLLQKKNPKLNQAALVHMVERKGTDNGFAFCFFAHDLESFPNSSGIQTNQSQ